MGTEKEIKAELLRQLEADLPKTAKKKEYTPEDIILKNKHQLRRLKRIAIISWIVTILYVLVMYNLKQYFLRNNFESLLTRDEFWFMHYSDIATEVLVIISALITYLVYYKSKTLTMLQVCARLENIENYLKKISTEK